MEIILKPSNKRGIEILSLVLFFILNAIFVGSAQQYYLTTNFSLYGFELEDSNCHCCFQYIGETDGSSGLAFTPDTQLLRPFNHPQFPGLYQINETSGEQTPFFNYPSFFYTNLNAIASIGNGVFYLMEANVQFEDEFYRLDLNDESLSSLGNTGYPIKSDLALFK